MENLGAIILLLVWAIPISLLVRVVAALFSARVRDSIAQHPLAHLIWLAAGIAVVLLPLLLPPLLKHPRLKKDTSFTTPNQGAPAASLGSRTVRKNFDATFAVAGCFRRRSLRLDVGCHSLSSL